MAAKRDHHKARVRAFEAVTQFDKEHFSCFDPPLTPEEDARLDEALDAARASSDIEPLTDFWIGRYEAAASTRLDIVRAICQDQDEQSDGSPVTPHIHFLSRAHDVSGALDLKELSGALGIASNMIEKPRRGESIDHFIENKSAYQIHFLKDEPGAAKYAPEQVYSPRGESFKALFARCERKWTFAREKKHFDDLDKEVAYYIEEIYSGRLSKRDMLADGHLRRLYGSSTKNHAAFDLAFTVMAEAKEQESFDGLDMGRIRKVIVWIDGEAGSGKSSLLAWVVVHFLQSVFGWETFYAGSKNPLDGYAGEEVIVLDDLRSKNADGDGIAYEEMLRLCDPHNARKSAARYHDPLAACRLVLATNPRDVRTWAGYARGIGKNATRAGSIDQLLRRIDFEVCALSIDRYGIYGNRIFNLEYTGPYEWECYGLASGIDTPLGHVRTEQERDSVMTLCYDYREVPTPAYESSDGYWDNNPFAIESALRTPQGGLVQPLAWPAFFTGFYVASKIIERVVRCSHLEPMTYEAYERVSDFYLYRLRQILEERAAEGRTAPITQLPASMLDICNVIHLDWLREPNSDKVVRQDAWTALPPARTLAAALPGIVSDQDPRLAGPASPDRPIEEGHDHD